MPHFRWNTRHAHSPTSSRAQMARQWCCGQARPAHKPPFELECLAASRCNRSQTPTSPPAGPNVVMPRPCCVSLTAWPGRTNRKRARRCAMSPPSSTCGVTAGHPNDSRPAVHVRARPPITAPGWLFARPRVAVPAAPAGAPESPGCPRGHADHSPSPGSAAGRAGPSPGWRRLPAR